MTNARYAAALMNTFDPEFTLVRGEGTHVWDSEGRRYLDMLGGIAVMSLGYANPSVVEAVSSQVATLGHASNIYSTPPQMGLAELIQAAFASEGYNPAEVRTFFTNSGAEANEAALKLARLHKPGGRIVALSHAFHGRTMGALAVTWKEAIRQPFGPFGFDVAFVEPTAEALRAEVTDDVAAVIMEPIQGEAGVLPVEAEVLREARRLCDAADALLVIDEIQTGIGRTGRWLASSSAVRADVITLAKGLGGGMPIGACVGSGRAATLFSPGSHGTTFGGNPVACAAGCAVMKGVAGLMDDVAARGAELRAGLAARGIPTRGRGLLVGAVVPDALGAVVALRGHGVLANAADHDTLRLAPPLTLTSADVAEFLAAVDASGIARS